MRSANSSDLLWSHQQQLSNGRSGGHGVPVDSVDLEGSRHAPHPLVGGKDLLIANQNPVWVFDWGGGESVETKWRVEQWQKSRYTQKKFCAGLSTYFL